MRTFWYATRLKSGAMTAVTTPELVVDGGAIAVMDGRDGVGHDAEEPRGVFAHGRNLASEVAPGAHEGTRVFGKSSLSKPSR